MVVFLALPLVWISQVKELSVAVSFSFVLSNLRISMILI